MNQEIREDSYVVECAWCGAKIREDKEQDSDAECLKCFYQMLSNHLQSQKRAAYGDFVSDR
jgi:DNA-directed RNA polymerase subunit RPC12/RpoP